MGNYKYLITMRKIVNIIIFLLFTSNYAQNANLKIFNEVNFFITSDYEKTNKLGIQYKDKRFVFGFVEDRAYLRYFDKSTRINDWKRVVYNFNYDSSFEEAEEKIRILCNDSEGFLLLPNSTEEFPIYAVYFFDNKGIVYLEDITTDNHNCLKQYNKIKINKKGNIIVYKVYDSKGNFVCKLIREIKSSFYREPDDLKKLNNQ